LTTLSALKTIINEQAQGEHKTDLPPSWRDAKKHEAEKHLPSSLYERRWALTALWNHIRTDIKTWRLSWANANRQADVQRTLTPIVSAGAGEISSFRPQLAWPFDTPSDY
jgi:hypothetical protein